MCRMLRSYFYRFLRSGLASVNLFPFHYLRSLVSFFYLFWWNVFPFPGNLKNADRNIWRSVAVSWNNCCRENIGSCEEDVVWYGNFVKCAPFALVSNGKYRSRLLVQVPWYHSRLLVLGTLISRSCSKSLWETLLGYSWSWPERVMSQIIRLLQGCNYCGQRGLCHMRPPNPMQKNVLVNIANFTDYVLFIFNF